MNDSDSEKTKQAARDFLGAMGEPGGWEPGSFTKKLIEAAMLADTVNRALLGTVYPELVFVVTMYKDVEGGRDFLIKLATYEPLIVKP